MKKKKLLIEMDAQEPKSSNSSTMQSTIPSTSSSSDYRYNGGRGLRRGGGRGPRGRGGRGGRWNRGRAFSTSASTRKKKFTGETAEMNQNVSETSKEHPVATQFKTTFLALERYATKTLKGTDLSSLFIDMEDPFLEESEDLPDQKTASAKDKKLFSLRLKRFVDQEDNIKGAMNALFSVIWGQCSKSMVTKLEAIKKTKSFKKKEDCASLLKEIKKITMKYKSSRNLWVVLDERVKKAYQLNQKDMTIHKYYEYFTATMDNISNTRVTFQCHDILVKQVLGNIGKDFDTANDDEKKFTYKQAKRKSDIRGGNPDLFGDLWMNLDSFFSVRGADEYPATVTDAYSMMVDHIKSVQANIPKNKRKSNSMSPPIKTLEFSNQNNKQSQFSPSVAFAQHQKKTDLVP